MALSSHDGAGNAVRLQSSALHKGSIQTIWSNNYGTTWDSFYVGTPPANEKANGFFACTDVSGGDDSRDMFIRLVNRHGRCMDVHFYFVPNASPKISAFVQNDAGGFDQVWTLG